MARDELRAELTRQAWSALADLFLGDEMHDRFHDAAAAAHLPHPGALRALLMIEAGDPRSMRSLAELLRCDASYITALVDALESHGYVERRTSPTDRRVKLVHLTSTGEQAKRRARAVIQRPPTALERLSDGEIRALAELTAKLG